MIVLERCEVMGWKHAIRGMRNPMNSWEKGDSRFREDSCNGYCGACFTIEKCHRLGPNDHELMMKLVNGGPVHAKYRRMITVYVDITAPLYWWKEFDTYKVGTVANSCSTMHKIHEKAFCVGDFSIKTLMRGNLADQNDNLDRPELKPHYKHFANIIASLNNLRDLYLRTNDKTYWYCMIESLPSSYNQKRTIMLNYEVLANIYESRNNHKLDEWREFCNWIETLPYSELITGPIKENKD